MGRCLDPARAARGWRSTRRDPRRGSTRYRSRQGLALVVLGATTWTALVAVAFALGIGLACTGLRARADLDAIGAGSPRAGANAFLLAPALGVFQD